MKKLIPFIFLCIVGFISIETAVYSQGTPFPPIFQNITLEGAGSYTQFKFDWSMHPSDTSRITKFKIYKANIFTNNYVLLTYWQTVNRYGTDTAWTVNVNPLFVNNYTFYITSIRKEGVIEIESMHSNLLQARFKQGHVDVVFTTLPPSIGSVGSLYQYNANAYSPDPATINYVLKNGPQAMLVESLTGLVTWLPVNTGRYNIRLNAFLNFNPIGIAEKGDKDGTLSKNILIDTSNCEVDQNWLLLVKSCNEPTYFSGSVTDENGDTMRNGIVTAYSVNNLDIDSVYYGIIGNDGHYSVEVLEGAYKLSAEGGSFQKEWNHNKATFNEADSTIANCGRTMTLNWTVTRNAPDTITFAYEPITDELVGNEYIYNGVAMSSSGRELRYSLSTAPQGMIIDPLTGLVHWTPSAIGRYYVSIKAYLLDDSLNSYAFKNFYIKVRSCINGTFIKGNVLDTAGNAINQGNISVHSDSGIDSAGVYFGTLNPDGTYFINIDEGNSKIYLEGESIFSQWYDNKLTQDSAYSVACPCGDTTEVNLLAYRIPPLTLSITSTPSNSTVVGSIYNYNPVVTGNNERELRYILINSPSDMTINPQKGEINWSPSIVGGYKVTLKAYLYTDSANSFVIQEWWLKVRSCTNNTYISGIVKDDKNNLIPNGTVKIIDETGIDSLGYYIGYIKEGAYRVLVDEGKCKVYVEGPTFKSQWYENADSENNALVITVPCGTNTSADFTVNLFKDYTVSGKVTDESTGNPIENASLYFKSSDTMDSTTTNQSGDYSIRLNEQNSYIAWAKVPQNPLYITQYYNLTGNITEATPVEFSGNIGNINFALKMAPVADNRMFGEVRSENGEPVKSIVLNFTVFPRDTSIASMFDARTYITGIDGTFEFPDLAEGDYLLLAIPIPDGNVPGYFKKDTLAVHSWLDASVIKIISGEASGPHTITLPYIYPTSGSGKISGIVTGDQLPAFLKNDDSPLAKEDIDGAVVITVDKDEKVRKYNLTNSIGVYSLDSLENGDYNVSIDKFGYGNYSYDITIDDNNQTHSGDAELVVELPVGVKDNLSDLAKLIKIYPNPADGIFQLQSDYDLSNSRISAFNLFGQSINLEKYMSIINTNSLKIKLDNVAQGLYFIKIDLNGKSIIKTVLIIK
ncbi:MAG: T9SS type A sorting domain-containing protein [Bacteroidetes bacterium]|nr:MAG: T9SS type A sorting domain-containing protein [Bacteroidota bacterium]